MSFGFPVDPEPVAINQGACGFLIAIDSALMQDWSGKSSSLMHVCFASSFSRWSKSWRSHLVLTRRSHSQSLSLGVVVGRINAVAPISPMASELAKLSIGDDICVATTSSMQTP